MPFPILRTESWPTPASVDGGGEGNFLFRSILPRSSVFYSDSMAFYSRALVTLTTEQASHEPEGGYSDLAPFKKIRDRELGKGGRLRPEKKLAPCSLAGRTRRPRALVLGAPAARAPPVGPSSGAGRNPAARRPGPDFRGGACQARPAGNAAKPAGGLRPDSSRPSPRAPAGRVGLVSESSRGDRCTKPAAGRGAKPAGPAGRSLRDDSDATGPGAAAARLLRLLLLPRSGAGCIPRRCRRLRRGACSPRPGRPARARARERASGCEPEKRRGGAACNAGMHDCLCGASCSDTLPPPPAGPTPPRARRTATAVVAGRPSTARGPPESVSGPSCRKTAPARGVDRGAGRAVRAGRPAGRRGARRRG